MSPTSSEVKDEPSKKQHEAGMKKKLKMEATSTYEMLVDIQQSREHITSQNSRLSVVNALRTSNPAHIFILYV
jgi:hypothetical protein